jgi:hypothetical protein
MERRDFLELPATVGQSLVDDILKKGRRETRK